MLSSIASRWLVVFCSFRCPTRWRIALSVPIPGRIRYRVGKAGRDFSSRSALNDLRRPQAFGASDAGAPAPDRLRRPVLELHAERQAHLGQDLLDLLQRLAAEVLGLQHLGLGALDQVADGLDVRLLQAVGASARDSSSSSTERKRFSLSFASSFGASTDDRLLGLVEVDEDRELLLDDLRRVGHRVLRGDRAVGPHLEAELVVVGDLTDAGVGDLVVHLADRARRASRSGWCRSASPATLLFSRRHVATAAAAGHLHPELAALGRGCRCGDRGSGSPPGRRR